MDTRFQINVISAITKPQTTVWMAMHQDYSHKLVTMHWEEVPIESMAGEFIVKHLLKGDRGHYGPFEHPQITINVGYFNHATMQQLRTHRVGVSFDVQSFRYTSQGLLDVVANDADIEDYIYFRPVASYTDRKGNRYDYTHGMREEDKSYAYSLLKLYYRKINMGMSEEHCRAMLPFDYRQHWVMSLNARSLMHFLDLRAKKDAELECQWFCELLFQKFQMWMPHVAEWYKETRWGKARLAP